MIICNQKILKQIKLNHRIIADTCRLGKTFQAEKHIGFDLYRTLVERDCPQSALVLF
jgi:hypothetical protein